MVVHFALLKHVITIEILLVISIILLTFGLKYYVTIKARRDKRISSKIEDYLVSTVAAQSTTTDLDFPKSWRRLDIMLPVVYKLDTMIQSPYWAKLKEAIARTILLPIARKRYDSRRWMYRLFSSQCFELAMEEQDEAIVSALLEDNIPLVHLHATIAAVKFSSITMINLVINSMSKKRRLGQTVYLKIFDMATPQSRQYVEDRLKTENDPFIRATCYKILLTYPQSSTSIDTGADINSKNMELQLSAVRYTAYAHKENAIPLLINLLSDSHWEIRAASNRLLGDLQARQAIKEISNGLKDPVWWVRVNAANALKSLGDDGIQILNAQDPKIDLYAYETAMHVLNKSST